MGLPPFRGPAGIRGHKLKLSTATETIFQYKRTNYLYRKHNHLMKHSISLTLLALITFASCVKKDTSSSVNASMTATVNSTAFSTTNCYTGEAGPGYYSITGIESTGNTVELHFVNTAGFKTGHYTIDSVNNTASYFDATGIRYAKTGGVFTIDTIGSGRAVGTFSFTCKVGSATTNVTNGKFVARY